MDLKFQELRDANIERCFQFLDARGNKAHPDGVKGWSITQWANACIGELGEAANLIKKIDRGDYYVELPKRSEDDYYAPDTVWLAEHKPKLESAAILELADELADVVIYFDLFCERGGISLQKIADYKFCSLPGQVSFQLVEKTTFVPSKTVPEQLVAASIKLSTVISAQTDHFTFFREIMRLSILANINLAEAVVRKFNFISDRQGISVRL